MRAWVGRLVRWGSRLLLGVGVFLVLALALVTQTAFGKERVLRAVLGRVETGVRGEIRVGDVSSPGLLNGFTFREVTILGEDGSTFLQADSIRTGLSAAALLRGDLVFTGVHLWRPRVTLRRDPGQDRMNVVEIFLGGTLADSLNLPRLPASEEADEPGGGREAETPDSQALEGGQPGEGESDSGPRRTILLRSAWIHQGSLDVLLPLGPERTGPERTGRNRILTVAGPDGRPTHRRFSFREIDLHLEQANLQAPGQSGERFEIDELSFLGEVWPDPFRVEALRGELRREGPRLMGTLESIRLPESEADGRVDVRWGEDRGVEVNARGEAKALSLEDLHFIEDRLPVGVARGPFGLELGPDGVLLEFRGTELESPFGGIRAEGGLFLGRELAFSDLELDLRGLDLAVTDAWVEDTLPLRGRMDGDLFMTGDLAELSVEGTVDLVDPDSVGMVTADILGRLGFEGGFSASSLQVTLAPLDWGAMASLSPTMRLRGSGSVRLVLTGSLAGDGLGIDGELTHFPGELDSPGAPGTESVGEPGRLARTGGASRVTVRGSVRREVGRTFLNLSGELSPLSLTAIRRSYPDLPVEGDYSGQVEMRGPLTDLEVRADLVTSGGPLQATARFDPRRPGRGYTLEVEADEPLRLSTLLPSLPDPTRWSGYLFVQGRGFSPDSVTGTVRMEMQEGQVGPMGLDSAALEGIVQDGLLRLDELVAQSPGGSVVAEGTFGIASTASPGEIALEVRSESLEPFRPFIMEEPEVILDELSVFERNLLAMEGVDLDTLPTAEEVAVGGAVQGTVTLIGGIRSFRGEGSLEIRNLRLRSDYVEAGDLSFSAQGLPGDEARLEATVRTDSVNIRSLGFGGGSLEVEMGRWNGRVRATARRGPEEEYNLRGTYALDSIAGGVVNLDQLTLRFDSVRWNLGGPSSFAWSPEGYRVRDFQLIRPGTESMRIRADGFIPLAEGGETDFEAEVEYLNLARLARVLQMETPMGGTLHLTARMTGAPADPQIIASARGSHLLFSDFSLGGLESRFRYGKEEIELDLRAFEGDRTTLAATGHFPADLRVRAEGGRLPDGSVDLSVSVDSFPASTTLAFMEALEDVEGTLTGDLYLGGTSNDLEPRGDLHLVGGSATIRALGVRHRRVEARLALSPDGVVEVDGSLRSEGTARVTGTVTLADPLSDPELNLDVEARDFLAVNRRDVQARLSGSVRVNKSYRRPRVAGSLTVEQGVLMVEEVARSVEVVDLSDPAFFDVVDTTLVTLRPIIQASQNPFLQNLQLAVDLNMAQDSWLRGRELNVELAGNLGVYWDRTERNLAFLGVLDAVRGVYSVFGRQFQVEGGTVSFPGTPGINPDLDIRARNRIRTSGNVQLDIVATVEGPLLEPRVSLSSNAAFPIAESDLVSYLIFGRPSYATASAQGAYAREAAGVFAGAASSLAVGLFSSELGSLLAEDVGLDYLAVTQGQGEALGMQALQGTVATTQVEIGQYLTEDIFAALHWRPWTTGTGQRQLAALRIETRLSDHWTLEGYWEDRFYRNPFYQIGTASITLDQVFGFFLYREWGY